LRLQADSPQDRLVFTVDDGDGGHPSARTQITVVSAQNSQLILHEAPFANQPRGQRWRAWVRFSHTGEAAGWIGETVAFASALGACVLVLTGLLLLYQRLTQSGRRSLKLAPVHTLEVPGALAKADVPVSVPRT
jgi:uncharacterized iron-regulated membrane protein